jgi:hypothetical protein
MQSQRFVDLEHDRDGHQPYLLTQALHGDRPDLLCLGLRVLPQASGRGQQPNLKWVDPPNVRRDRKYGDYAAPKAGRDGIGTIVAYDDGWTALTRFRAAARIEIDNSDLPTSHQEGKPSAEVESHSSSSSLAAHSRQASSYAAPKPEARSNLTALCTTADRDS